MKITGLVRGKKSKRINVFVENEYSFSVEEMTLVKENLFSGKEITQEEIERIKEKDLVEKFVFKTVELIGSRPRSVKEIKRYIEQKLRNKKYYDIEKHEIENISEKVIEKLSGNKYLDDKEFAAWWIKSRMEHRPRGQQVLRQELFNKGIEKEIINEILENNFDKGKEIDTAYEMGKKKLVSLKSKDLPKMEKKARISRFLIGKGYNWEVISEVFKMLEL